MRAVHSSGAVVDDEHVQLLPAAKLFGCDQQMFLELLRGLLGRQGHETLEGAGHQIGAGDAAEQTLREIPQLQGVEDVQQVLLQGVVLIDEGEADQHVAVDHLAGVQLFAAAAGGGDGADGEGGVVKSRGVRALADVDDAVLQPVVPAVVEIEIQPPGLKKGALSPEIPGGGGRRDSGGAVIRQLAQVHVQGGADVVEGLDVQSDLAGLIFADAGPALVDQVRQLLERQAPGLPIAADPLADMLVDLAHAVHHVSLEYTFPGAALHSGRIASAFAGNILS